VYSRLRHHNNGDEPPADSAPPPRPPPGHGHSLRRPSTDAASHRIFAIRKCDRGREARPTSMMEESGTRMTAIKLRTVKADVRNALRCPSSATGPQKRHDTTMRLLWGLTAPPEVTSQLGCIDDDRVANPWRNWSRVSLISRDRPVIQPPSLDKLLPMAGQLHYLRGSFTDDPRRLS